MNSPQKVATTLLLKLDEIIESNKAEALQRRLSDFPSLLTQAGLASALTFYLSKMDKKEKRNSFAVALIQLSSSNDECVSRMRKVLLKDVEEEGGGYGPSLALILKALAECIPSIESQLRRIETETRCNERMGDDMVKGIVKIIKSITEEGKEMEAELCLIPILVEMKKIATALYKHDEKEKK